MFMYLCNVIWILFDLVSVSYLKEYFRIVFGNLFVDRKCGKYGFMNFILLYNGRNLIRINFNF